MAHLLTGPDDEDTITFTVRRNHLVAAFGAAGVYGELVLVQHLAPAPAAIVATLTFILGLLRRS
ncbi:hypothetical protein [Streptomyces sp. NPDC056713]|uniref:hypothetical protein n=1 Tax=Streptomyces sp. NPDC056713 TaxID=3345921 RepID=UPI00368E2979